MKPTVIGKHAINVGDTLYEVRASSPEYFVLSGNRGEIIERIVMATNGTQFACWKRSRHKTQYAWMDPDNRRFAFTRDEAERLLVNLTGPAKCMNRVKQAVDVEKHQVEILEDELSSAKYRLAKYEAYISEHEVNACINS